MRVEGDYINVNDLYGSVTDGSGGKAKRMSYNNSKARYAEINGIVKYDHWITVLEAFNTDIPAKGGYVTDLLEVTSYGTDYRDVKHQMKDSGDLTFSKTYISENTSTTSTVSHDITITQVKTGKSITVTLTQAKAEEVKYTLEHTLNVGTASAKGGWVQVSVSWTRYKNGEYYDSGTAYPSISGYASVDGAYASGSEVYIPNAGTNTSQPTAYTITSYSFTVDGEEYEESASKRITLGYNYITDTSTEYSVSTGTASVSTIANTGGTFSFTATCQSRETTTYYSGSVVTGSWSNASATVSYSNGVSSVSHTSFTGSATITATVGENFDDARYPRVTVKASNDTSVSDYTQVTQSAVSYTFTAITSTSVSLGSTTTSFSVSVRSERNGKPWAISSSNVSAGNYASVVGVNQSSYPTYQYNITLSTTANNSSSNRNYLIVVTQPSSGKTLTFNVIHSSATSSAPISYIWKFENDSYCIRNGWYLGQIPTGATTNGRPVYHIVAVTTKANSQAASIYAEFDYTYNPSDAAGNLSGSISKSFSYTAGATISVDGTSYYGVILVTGLPAISQGTVTEFTVTKT